MAVIGRNTIGANSDASAADWNPEALVHSSYRYTATTGDTVTEIAAYGDGTGTCQIGVYVFSGGVPTTRVNQAILNIGSTAGWYTQAVSWALTNGVEYVVAMDFYHDASWNIRYEAGPGGTAAVADWTSSFNLPATWTVSSTGTDAASFYATVTGGAADATATPAVVTAAVSIPTATATSANPKTQFAYDFDVEKKVIDDVAINWDDPDFVLSAPPGNASVTAAIVTGVVSVPSPTVTVSVNASVTATIVTAAVSVPAPTPATPSHIIGNNTIGANSAASDPTWHPEALVHSSYRYTALTGDSVTEVATYGDGTGTAVIGLYVFSGGVPTTRVDSVVINIGASPAWYTQAVSWPLTNGVEYVVAMDYYWDASWSIRYGAGPGGTASVPDWTSGHDLPATWTVSDSGTDAASFYATVSSGGGNASVTAPVVTANVSVGTASANGAVSVTASVVTLSVSVIGAGATTPGTTLYPKSISGRKLLDQNSNVFLLPTMASWAMASQLSNANITSRLNEVAANGFKGVTVFIGGGYNIGSGWNTYTNQAGDQYWTTVAGGNTSATPWACGVGSAGTQLGAAWATFDWIITETARLGLVLTAAFCGGFGTTGAGDDWEGVTNTQMYNTGVKIASRYLGLAPHMIWELMLDDTSTTTGSTRGTRIQNLFSGINDTEGTGARFVRWVEPGNNSTSVSTQGWYQNGFFNCQINCMYTYDDESVEDFETAWGETSGPTGDCEPPYVGAGHYSPANEHQKVRERNYAVFLEGGCLINFGHEDWWPFGATGLFSEGLTAATVQASASLLQASYCWAFIDAYVKDSTWAPSSFVTTGQGSGATKASAGASNTRAAAYFPNSRTIVVDTTVIAGSASVRLRWFDPSNNTYNTISASEAQNATRSVTHPGNGTNSVGQSDYVLLVEELTSSSVTASVVTAAVSVLTPSTVSAGRNISASVVPAPVSVPNPTVTATSTASVTASVVTTAVSVPAPGIAAGTAVSVTALVVPAPVSVLAPTLHVGQLASPSTVTANTSVPAPSASGAALASPAVVTAVVSVPAPAPHANASVTATIVTTTVSVGSPTVSTATTASVSAPTVTLVTAVISPAAHASSSVSPPIVTAIVAVLNPAPHASAAPTATIVTANVSVPAPTTVSVGRNISAAVVTALVQVGGPGVTAGGGAAVTAATVTATTSLPAPAVTTILVVHPTVVTANVSIPAPAPGIGRTVTAAVVTAVTAVSLPTVSAGGGVSVTAAAATINASIPAPAVSAAARATPQVVTAVTSVPVPTLSNGFSFTAPVVTVAAQVGSPSVVIGGGASVAAPVVTVTASVTGTASLPVHITASVVALPASVPTPSLIKHASVTAAVVTIHTFLSGSFAVVGTTLESIVIAGPNSSNGVSSPRIVISSP